MKKQIITTSLAIVFAALLSGCATSQGTPSAAPTNAVQSSTGPTVSGYVDVGAEKSFH